MKQIQDFLNRLDRVRKLPRREQWRGICPVHDDHKPSLYITYNDKGIACKCLVCGANGKDVCNALGIPVSELFFEKAKPKRKGKIEKVYDYVSLDGEYLYSRIRYVGKEFSQGVRVDGQIIKEKPQNLHGIYTHSLEALRASQLIAITEGERDTDTVHAEGIQAFTYGSSKGDWQPDFAELCTGKDIVIFIDNDPDGKAVAHQIESDLQGKAKSILPIIPTPNIQHGDISDYISGGGDIFALIAEHRQGTTKAQDIGSLFCDDKFNELSVKQQNLYLRILYQFPLLDIDTPDRKGCIYLNRALLSNVVGMYARTDGKGIQKDIGALVERGYIQVVCDGFKEKKRSIYKVL